VILGNNLRLKRQAAAASQHEYEFKSQVRAVANIVRDCKTKCKHTTTDVKYKII